jgi:YVTN family beta-propeller protein
MNRATHHPRRQSKTSVIKAAGLSLVLVGCTAASEDVRPPADQLFFPTGVAIDPAQSVLFVASANSELRYDSGTISVFDLTLIDEYANNWSQNGVMPDGCAPDVQQRETLQCDNEGVFMKPGAGIRTGNFATALTLQRRDLLDENQLRLHAAVRGDPSVTWADWDGEKLACASGQGFELCDEDHRLILMRDDPDLPSLVDEPFQLYADSTNDYVVVTHLTSGTVTLVDSPRGGAPVLADVITGLFAPNSNNQRGAAAVAGRNPGSPDNLVYVTSRTEDRVQMLTVFREPEEVCPIRTADGRCMPYFVLSNYFFLDAVGSNNGGSADTRAAVFSTTGEKLYLANRQPPSLQVYDTSNDVTGFPKNVALAGTDLCRETSNLAIANLPDGERAFSSCFQDGEIYVIDPRAGAEVEAIVTVGRGPFGVAASSNRAKLYVTNFLDDTIAVVELDPLSPRRFQVVLRIGAPRE